MISTKLSLGKIGQIAVNSHDVIACTLFYRDALGLKHLLSVGDHLAFFDCGGVRLMLTRPEPAFDHPSSIIYFLVDDIDAGHAALVTAHVKIEQPPQLTARLPDHELWLCFFRDPDNNLLALMSEKRPSR